MYETIRNLLCPFDKIEELVPTGKILDVGCGHGILARTLSKNSLRVIVGIDPSSKKIFIAKKLAKGIRNITFKKDYIENIKGKFDCITIIDVLYILPYKEKIKLLRKIKSLLNKNGILILKEVNTYPRWMYHLSKMEEDIMIKFMRYTHSDYHSTHMQSPNELRNTLKNAGLKIKKVAKFYGKLGYPSHILYLATPNEKDR